MHMRQAYIFCWQYLFHIFIFNFISFFVVEPPITAPESRIDSFSAHISFVSICGWMVVHCCLCLKYVYRCLRKNVLFSIRFQFQKLLITFSYPEILFVWFRLERTTKRNHSHHHPHPWMNDFHLFLVICVCYLFVCLSI